MNAGEYRKDPCGASALPLWKTQTVTVPENLLILRDDVFSPETCKGRDEPYFKAIHTLEHLEAPCLPEGFALAQCSIEDYAAHIRACYPDTALSTQELRSYRTHPVYDPQLWIAIREASGQNIVASGIAELDARIGEGALEWIQVSPGFRRMRLGRFVVCELLRRMRGRANFATVSGKKNDPNEPLALYTACGFQNPVIWHVVTLA